MKKLIVILLAVAAVFGMTSCNSSSPSKVVTSYYKALQAGDLEKAMTYTDLTSDEEIQKQIEKFNTFEIKSKILKLFPKRSLTMATVPSWK